MKRLFRHLSIEHKLNLIVFIAVTSAMGMASALLIGRYAQAARKQHAEDLATLADVIAINTQAALLFRDAADAAETLAALRMKDSILAAMLYDNAGRPFARYDREDRGDRGYPPLPVRFDPYDEGDMLWKATSIEQNGERIGILLMQADLGPLRATIRNQILVALLLTAGSVLLGVLLASRLQHLILRHIRRVVDMAKAVALGDLPEHLDVTSEDEIGALERAFNQIIDTTRGVVRQTQTLARGDYSITIEPRSGRDELSHALITMTRALKSYHEESVRQARLKSGISELNDRIRGEQETLPLLRNILDCLVANTTAQAAVLYLARDDGSLAAAAVQSASLRLEDIPCVVAGEGPLGQAAADRQVRLLSGGAEALPLRTGLVNLELHDIALVPLVHDQDLVGLLEIGAAGPIDGEARDLLKLAAPTVAIAIQSARSRQRLRELLDETQRQSRELQLQQAALQNSNRELEQRNQLLEHQQQEIHRQNKALDAARLDLERKARELEMASRYKSEFLANMSHELRTPLNSMLILSRLLADNKEGNLNRKETEFALTINKAGTELLALINDILDLSKVEAGMLEINEENVDVADISRSLEQIFRPLAAEKNIGFVVEVDPAAPRILRTDAKRVGQILRNLIGNAFKFTHQGSVTLRVWKPEPGAARKPAGIAFSVIDTGIGIPPDKHDLIFRAFQQADGTTSRKYGGTGLGLSISRELALRLGGDISVQSTPGHGSTFTVSLPGAAVADEQSAVAVAPESGASVHPTAAAVPASATGSGGKRLLVIEDDATFAGIVGDIAKERGYAVSFATNGTEAMALARSQHPSGIVMDIMLPGASGHDLLAALKEDAETRAIAIYVISALEADPQLARQGAIGFATKPVSPGQIHQAINRIEWVAQRTQKVLLVVDDDRSSLDAVQELLAGWPVRVIRCETGHEAIHLAKTTDIDGILLDWGLKDMTGREVLDALEPFPPDAYVPVILYTGRDISREEEAALRKRIVGIVLKGDQAPSRLLAKLAFFLHLHAPATVQPAAVRQPARDASLAGRRVLIVDDDMRNSYSLSAVIDAWGAESLLAPDGPAALAMLEQDPGISLVLMDIMMPGMDGYQVIREIRRRPRLKEIPVIALTAKAMREDREACLAAGANDYLAKPVDMDQLMLLVKNWIRR